MGRSKKLIIFLQENKFKISKQLSKNKTDPIIISFDGFNYQIFVTQAEELSKCHHLPLIYLNLE